MRVLAFSAYYTPEIAASMYLTEDIYKGIVDAGHTLEVYVPAPTRGVTEEIREEYKKKKVEKEYDGKLTIHRIAMYREGKNSILRALRYFFVNVVFIWKGLRTNADVIFVQSTPPTQGMMAGILSKWKKIPLVYNLQDIFPDSLVNSGMTSENSIIWRVGRRVEDYSYRHSKKIIVISEDFKKNILTKGVPEEKIIVVPNWADVSGVFPVERKDNVLIKRYNLDPSKFYITYCGNVGFTQNMDLLLDVAKELRNDLPNLVFIIIGDGADKERVLKRLEDERIENIIMLPFQPYEDIANVFSLGDVGMIISKPGVGNNSVPSKTWSIMAAGKPVLASFDKDSELCKLLDIIRCGIHVDAGDKDGLLMAIMQLYYNRMNDMGKAGFDYITSVASKEKSVIHYIRAIEEACVG